MEEIADADQEAAAKRAPLNHAEGTEHDKRGGQEFRPGEPEIGIEERGGDAEQHRQAGRLGPREPADELPEREQEGAG